MAVVGLTANNSMQMILSMKPVTKKEQSFLKKVLKGEIVMISSAHFERKTAESLHSRGYIAMDLAGVHPSGLCHMFAITLLPPGQEYLSA